MSDLCIDPSNCLKRPEHPELERDQPFEDVYSCRGSAGSEGIGEDWVAQWEPPRARLPAMIGPGPWVKNAGSLWDVQGRMGHGMAGNWKNTVIP